MFQGKFKIYDEKQKKLLSGTGYSITGDGEVQTFNRDGVAEGTAGCQAAPGISQRGQHL